MSRDNSFQVDPTGVILYVPGPTLSALKVLESCVGICPVLDHVYSANCVTRWNFEDDASSILVGEYVDIWSLMGREALAARDRGGIRNSSWFSEPMARFLKH